MSVENYLAKTMLAMGAMFTANTTLAQNAVLSDDSKSQAYSHTLKIHPHTPHLYEVLYKRIDPISKTYIRFSIYDADSNHIVSLHQDDIESAQYTHVRPDSEEGSYTDDDKGVRVFYDYATNAQCEKTDFSKDEIQGQIISLLFLNQSKIPASVTGRIGVPVINNPE